MQRGKRNDGYKKTNHSGQIATLCNSYIGCERRDLGSPSLSSCVTTLHYLVLVAILAQTLLALVRSHLMTLVLLTVWHTF